MQIDLRPVRVSICSILIVREGIFFLMAWCTTQYITGPSYHVNLQPPWQKKKIILAEIHMIVYTKIQIAYWITELNHLYAFTVIWSFFFF